MSTVNTNIIDNAIVLANAIDIGTEIIAKISGNLISNRLDGEVVSDRTIASIIASDIHNALEGK